MKKSFFEKNKTPPFETKVRTTIRKIKKFGLQGLKKDPQLNKYVEEFSNLVNSNQFAEIPEDLQKDTREMLMILTNLHLTQSQKVEPEDCHIQIPAKKDLEKMTLMPAGGKEDQAARLTTMCHIIEQAHKKNDALPVITTEEVSLPVEWTKLFASINEDKKQQSIELFAKIPKNDVILKALLAVHPEEYLKKLITYCLDARFKGTKKLNSDIIIKPNTFEILIKDIATSLLSPAKLCFSFGLPTHHAYSDEGSGFCIINKTAVIMKHIEMANTESLKFVIVGTDVNRDDGLCSILRTSMPKVCHIDIFDSRVYPHHNHSHIAKEFKTKSKSIGKIQHWNQNNFDYYAVDLSLTVRDEISTHPAILFALKKIKENISYAKKNNQKIFLVLPTGWDSHQDETASCGKVLTYNDSAHSKNMSEYESRIMRFNSGDLSYFFENVLTIYNKNQDYVEGIYWGLEGGYEPAMYKNQLQSMLSTIMKQPFLQDTSQNTLQI